MILAWTNRATGTLRVGRKTIHLSPMEAKVAECLMHARGQEVSADRLLFAVYNGEDEPEWAAGNLKVFIHNIRRKGLPIEPRNSGHRCGYWLEGVDWFTKGQRFSTPAGNVRVESVILEPSLILFNERIGLSSVIPLSDKRIEKWEAS